MQSNNNKMLLKKKESFNWKSNTTNKRTNKSLLKMRNTKNY